MKNMKVISSIKKQGNLNHGFEMRISAVYNVVLMVRK